MKFAFFSTMEGSPWGASEELWGQAAAALQNRGHRVAVNCKCWAEIPPQIDAIRRNGGSVHRRCRWEKIAKNVQRSLSPVGLYRSWLKRVAPDFLLISSACQTGDLAVALDCLDLNVPYGILLHAVNPAEGIRPKRRELSRRAYQGARQCFFVSPAIMRLMRGMLACQFAAPAIVDNPPNVPRESAPPWPADSSVWKLACPARFDLSSKGHDLTLEVLGADRWRSRPLRVHFWGPDGADRDHVVRLAHFFGVDDRVAFCGRADNIQRLWGDYHGLLLPSRHEGVPLVTVEAMLCGRIPIVTDVGRNGEFVDDGATGFLAAAATVESLDQCLERAWQGRHHWQSMGRLAAQRIRERTSADPVGDFCDQLERCAAGDPASTEPRAFRAA